MASNRTRRIAKEISEIQKDQLSQIHVEPANGDDLSHLKGSFQGPPDTPYEGGKFVIDIKIPSEYPFRPPVMKFDTRIWHPNVSSVTGAICLDTLGNAWSPVLTIKSALISLQSLLSTPEPKDPQDAEVAGMLLKNPAQFNHTAREWAVKHAGAPKKERGEGSGGATAESLRQKAAEARESRDRNRLAQYRGFNKNLIDRFVAMGFDVPDVVQAFEDVGIDRNDGQDYELEEAYMGDITARLFGEPLEGHGQFFESILVPSRGRGMVMRRGRGGGRGIVRGRGTMRGRGGRGMPAQQSYNQPPSFPTQQLLSTYNQQPQPPVPSVSSTTNYAQNHLMPQLPDFANPNPFGMDPISNFTQDYPMLPPATLTSPNQFGMNPFSDFTQNNPIPLPAALTNLNPFGMGPISDFTQRFPMPLPAAPTNPIPLRTDPISDFMQNLPIPQPAALTNPNRLEMTPVLDSTQDVAITGPPHPANHRPFRMATSSAPPVQNHVPNHTSATIPPGPVSNAFTSRTVQSRAPGSYSTRVDQSVDPNDPMYGME